MAIVASLLEPNFTGLMEATGDVVGFAGIPVVLMGYSGTVIPAILAVLVYSKLEKLLKKFIPKSMELFMFALVALLIMVPLTTMVIGPVGVTLGDGIANGLNFLGEKSGLLTGALIGAGWTFLVMIGIHWGVVPLMINNLALYGYDVIRPMIAAATFASAGAAFGAFLKMKHKENKAFALSSTIPALLGGITEPIVYGISVKYRRPMIAQVIGGAAAGGFMGAMGTKAFVYVFPALTTLPAFFGETFVFYCIGITMAFAITAALTYILGFDEVIPESAAVSESDTEEIVVSDVKTVEIEAGISGSVVKLENVKDELFASKAMGDGIAIAPEEGVLYAPVSGKAATVFPTGHAIGIVTEDGAELLIHIGINTVDLKGGHFEVFISQGQRVEKGQMLVKFDKDKIIQDGYDVTTMMVLTNMDTIADIAVNAEGKVVHNQKLLTVNKK